MELRWRTQRFTRIALCGLGAAILLASSACSDTTEATPDEPVLTQSSVPATTTPGETDDTLIDSEEQTTFADPQVATTVDPSENALAPQDLRAAVVEPRLVVLQWSLVEGAEDYVIFRDNLLAGTTTTGRFEDSTSPGESYLYAVRARQPNGDTGEADLTVTTPPSADTNLGVETVIRDAQSRVRSLGLGPTDYWRVTPICDGCDFETKTLSSRRGTDAAGVWSLPDAHPGIKNPETVHAFLLEAIQGGQAVVAEFADNGVATLWTVDGFGMTSDCYMFDTMPPEMVVASKADGSLEEASHCGYSGKG